MRFSIHTVTNLEWSLLEIKDEETGTEVKILPEYGAMLNTFSVRKKNGESVNVIHHYDNIYALKHGLDQSYQSAKLSPFVCRISNGAYSFDGKSFHFKKKFADGSAIHGLLFNKNFTIVRKFIHDDSAAVTLSYLYKKDDPAYPFDYSCQITYTLKNDNVLEVQTIVTNDSESLIPIADGWHPYFKLGPSINQSTLQFEAAALLEFNDKLIPTGNLIPEHRFDQGLLINNLFLDNCFLLPTNAHQPVCKLLDESAGLTLSISPDAAYPYLQIYTPADRKSIAIENLSGAPDCFNNKMGLDVLKPGHSKSFSVQYQLTII